MTKIRTYILTCIFISFFHQTSHAEELNFSLSGGFNDIDLKSVKEADLQFSIGVGYKLSVGKKFSKNVAWVAFYGYSQDSNRYKIGDIDNSILDFLNDAIWFGLVDTGIYATASTNVDFIGLGAKYDINLSKNYSFNLNAGISYWKARVIVSTPGFPTETTSEDGTGMSYGFGITRNLENNWKISYDPSVYIFDDIKLTTIYITMEKTF